MPASALAPSSTSGAVNAGEPVITPVAVWKAPGDPGDSEVGQLRFAVVGQQDVARLHVTMQYARAMRGFERTRQLHADAQRLAPVERSVPADQRLQRILGVVGHHDERPALASDADLKNVSRCAGARKAGPWRAAREGSGRDCPGQVGGQHLDGDRAVQHRLSAAIDHPESAVPDFLDVVKSRGASSAGMSASRSRCVACGSTSAIDGHYPQPGGFAPIAVMTRYRRSSDRRRDRRVYQYDEYSRLRQQALEVLNDTGALGAARARHASNARAMTTR